MGLPAARRSRYLQSALTLGGGTASACLLAGAAFGYELLWVAPLGIGTGAVVLLAVAHQTLSTGLRPLVAMRTYAGPGYAACWTLGCLLASLIWHFPQYALGSALLVDLGASLGFTWTRPVLGGETPASGALGREVVRVLYAAYQSAREGRRVALA